jgi:tyrosyl-tRNA synthetase
MAGNALICGQNRNAQLMNLIEELKWRGMIQDIMPGTAEHLDKLRLNGEITTGYIGFDPTSDSLHIGSLVPILLLVHLQRAGHKPVALVGGATGMVGDPSGKSEERNLLSEEVLNHNLAGVKRQLEKYLDFSPHLPNGALMVNNYDWFRNITFLDFIRDVGKHITVNYMSSKDSVKKRLEGENGMSFTEFTYQLVQGYDFYWLYTHKNCKLQMGGSDQWGNITTGTELIRRKNGGEAFAFTCPLLTKADGGKFGKTEKGNVWLDPEKTSPYLFYQFWLNATDTDAEKWIKIFTFLSPAEIDPLLVRHTLTPQVRELQKVLAQHVTIFVHGEEGYQKALADTEKIFANQSAPAESLTAEDLESMEGIARYDYPASKLGQGIDAVSFLAETGIIASKGEARKLIQGGGISINRKKVENAQLAVDNSLLLHGKYILVQKGKKNYYLVTVG